MKKTYLFILTILINTGLKSQGKDSCVYYRNQKVIDSAVKSYRLKKDSICNRETSNINVFVKGFPYQKIIYIEKDSLIKGFNLELSDPSYKISGFSIFFEFPGDPLGEEIIFDNKVIPENLDFLPRIKGYGNGYFHFTCIAIEKNGRKYKAKEFTIILNDK
ncbi:MAG: hypothetical protein KAY50_02440 [Chitinophagaceae bacterium]|nr:hypothetical protein [Chitinophagaceae bacterium]